MQVEIINTGSELMLGFVLNTHQQWLCRQLSDLGFEIERQVAVHDEGLAIQQAVREAIQRAELVITTGGLGPTSDDITRDLIAQLLDKPLREDSKIVADIEHFFAQRSRQMPASTRVQAMVPEGAVVLWNHHGTAPGLALPTPRGWLVMLPGPPRELRPMFRDQLVPKLAQWFSTPVPFVCKTLKTTGLGESFLEERIGPTLSGLVARGLGVGYCALVGQVDVRFTARGDDSAQLVAEAVRVARELLGSHIFSETESDLASVVVGLLTRQNHTLAIAESCTGGYVANRITNVPGASTVFQAGLVTYSNAAKTEFLGVQPSTLDQHGAVSEATASEMALGAQRRTGATYALALTGIAGPSGGTSEKPVGTVFIGFATPEGVVVHRFLNEYDRETFKFYTSQQALDILRRSILKASGISLS